MSNNSSTRVINQAIRRSQKNKVYYMDKESVHSPDSDCFSCELGGLCKSTDGHCPDFYPSNK